MNLKSISNQDLIKVGVVKSPKGLKGEIKVHLFSGEASWVKQIKTVALQNPLTCDLKNYSILNAQYLSQILLLKLTDITTREDAEALKRAEVWVPAKFFETVKGDSIYLREIQGFEVFNKENLVGKIMDFSTNGAQDLLLVRSVAGDNDIFIPLIKIFTVKIDHESRKVFMDLPEGLLEINYAL